ncbi:putative bifunctional diguanylate cyclase/phosphodiesterase [Agrobacterium vitis]|uniref:putative bifunctional diguanylate cyclase/phosphodiesterase n=1 Tax=Agrobacterium vitis TaxID=373 RepID=UPI0012E7DFB0|nr:EAL domain-containing protein [Agrobacterium vitis]MVA34027.1 EAL domain-containing protein [Agrobacterium vitis]
MVNQPLEVSDLDRIDRLTRRLEREREARRQAETLLEARARELYMANCQLARQAEDLEQRVMQRTAELVQERERAMALAQQDQLTGLANRRSFTAVLTDTCQKSRLRGDRITVILVDMDRFKLINDAYGHEAGDAVLREFASRLMVAAGPGTVARLGGDEFALILDHLPDATADHAFVSSFRASLQEPVLFNGKRLEVSASIGYASLPDHAASSTELLRHADMALYVSKKAGLSLATGFDDDLWAEANERRLLELELVLAMDRHEIMPWYQPIVDGASKRILGVEVLARWHHPYRGLVLPGVFLPLAEERNLLDRLFAQVARAACAQTAPLVKAGKLNYVSVNISPSQFKSGNLAMVIASILEQTGFPATALVVEITEDLIMSDMLRAGRELSELSRLGVRVALDDFGTGYSNISSLSSLPIQWLKLDRSLISRVGDDRVGQVIVQAVLQMAQALGIDVVAEGIETEVQARWLVEAGCRKHQGFLYGRPAPLEDLPGFSQPERPSLAAGKIP